MVVCVAVNCKRCSRQGKVVSFYKFARNEYLKQQLGDKNKTWKYPDNATCQNVPCLLLRVKYRLEKSAILAGPEQDFLHTPPPLTQ